MKYYDNAHETTFAGAGLSCIRALVFAFVFTLFSHHVLAESAPKPTDSPTLGSIAQDVLAGAAEDSMPSPKEKKKKTAKPVEDWKTLGALSQEILSQSSGDSEQTGPVKTERKSAAPQAPSPPLPSAQTPKKEETKITQTADPPSGTQKTVITQHKDESPVQEAAAQAPPNAVREEPEHPQPNSLLLQTNSMAPSFSSNESEASRADSDVSFVKFLGEASDRVTLDVGDAPSVKADILEPLRIEEAVAFALKNNFEVKASGAKSDSATWDKLGAYSEYLPSVEYTYAEGSERSQPASYNDAWGNRVMDSKHFRRDRALFVRQPLVDLSIIADIQKGHNTEDLSSSDQLDVREDIAFKTVNVFLRLIQARKTIQLADQYKGYLEVLARRMKERVDGGGSTGADLDRIRSRSTLADAARLEAIGEYGMHLAEFKRLTKVVPAQLEIPEKVVPETPPSSQEALDKALKSNPAYLSSLKKVDIAESDRNRSAANLLPKLSVEYAKIYTYDAGGSADGNPIDGVFPNQKDDRLMLVARWAISGGTAVASSLSGAAKVRQMNFLAQDVRGRLEEAIHTGYDTLNASRKRILILRETLRVDENVARDFEMQYSEGNRSLFDLLDAYERLHNAQLELMRTIIAEAQVAYQIRRQMGELADAITGNKES
jgi:outer membrane protein TolC